MTIEDCDSDWVLYDLLLYIESGLNPRMIVVVEKLLLSRIKQTRRRVRLWLENSECYWCGVETVLRVHINIQKKDYATIDHLRDRYDPERGKGNEVATVLSCKECNEGRASDRTKALPMEELWKRSGRSPVEIRNLSTAQ